MYGIIRVASKIFTKVYKERRKNKLECVHAAIEMITGIKACPLLKAYRKLPPVDIDASVKIILKTSKLLMNYKEIKELDLNPIMFMRKGKKRWM